MTIKVCQPWVTDNSDIHSRDRNWLVQAGSPDNIFDKKCLYV